ncbi:hypothetical protein FSS13T_04940 [Flavobacterium saliperosum S13]|uniref:Uncharacterized protein n=1 Tax=Flavobacterium saliperosum S13 TaxID=1341155 RepID=A0ABN0QJN0_9FLAO|nr:hypothetical protein FSS13T_04940 [Flavobacterium saliperosum S13]
MKTKKKIKTSLHLNIFISKEFVYKYKTKLTAIIVFATYLK